MTLTQKIKSLCLKVHHILQHHVPFKQRDPLDDTIMSISQIQELDEIQMLKNILDAILQLISIQRSLSLFKNYSIDSPSSIQQQLQTLQSSIRTHLRNQFQLKLLLQSIQQKLQQSQKTKLLTQKDLQTQTEKLENQRKNLLSRISQMSQKPKPVRFGLQPKFYQTKGTNSHISIDRKEAINIKTISRNLKRQNTDYRKLINKTQAIQKSPQPSTLEFYKLKYQQKCHQISKIKQAIKEAQQKARSYSPNIDLRKKTPVKITRVSELYRNQQMSNSNQIILLSSQIQEQELPYKEKYEAIQQYFINRELLKQEFEKFKKELDQLILVREELRSNCVAAKQQLKEKETELNRIRSERDQVIGQTYVLRLNGPQESEIQAIVDHNRKLQDTLVSVKLQHANLCEELESVKDQLVYFRRVSAQKEKELTNLTSEMESSARQRDQLKSKVIQGYKNTMSHMFAQPPPGRVSISKRPEFKFTGRFK